jgi:hypothetical protein
MENEYKKLFSIDEISKEIASAIEAHQNGQEIDWGKAYNQWTDENGNHTLKKGVIYFDNSLTGEIIDLIKEGEVVDVAKLAQKKLDTRLSNYSKTIRL